MSAAEAYGALNRTERIVSQPKVAQEYLPGKRAQRRANRFGSSNQSASQAVSNRYLVSRMQL
jgi:hypothetical protein